MKLSKNFVRSAAVIALIAISAATGVIMNRDVEPAAVRQSIPVSTSTPEKEVANKIARLLDSHPEEWEWDVHETSLDNPAREISIYVGDEEDRGEIISLYIDNVEMPGYADLLASTPEKKIIGDAVTRWSLVTRDGKKFRQEVQQKAATEAFLSSEE